jgi:hypothetical protein
MAPAAETRDVERTKHLDNFLDGLTAARLAELVEEVATGKLTAESWQHFFVTHYPGDVLEAARAEAVGIAVSAGDDLTPDAVAKLQAIAERLRSFSSDTPDIPNAWQAFPCSDYFVSGYAKTGWWDAASQCWYILPAERSHVGLFGRLLIIGSPGVDGIRWGYRLDHSGLWAHYPIDNEFRFVAPTVSALHVGYASGQITV